MRNELTIAGVVYGDENRDKNVLVSASVFMSDSPDGSTLQVDTLTANIKDYTRTEKFLAANGKLLAADGRFLIAKTTQETADKLYKYGDDVLYAHDGNLVGKFKLDKIERVGKNDYKVQAISIIGLLLSTEHYGGIYTGEKAGAIISEIVGGKFSYKIDPDIESVKIYGWLPIATRRDNLQSLLFAIGGQVRKDENGDIMFLPWTEKESYRIGINEFYNGGSVTGGNPASGVDVTEHTFMALDTDDEVVLFDGEASGSEMLTPKGNSVSGVIVKFQDPMHDLKIDGGSILEYGVNYAIISSSPNVVLKGKKYSHTTRIISRRVETNSTENIATSKKCTLINMFNSELVADRLMSYYSSAKTIKADIVLTDQKTGDIVKFTDPFGDETEGYINSIEAVSSATVKAKATIISGYTPVGVGNYYQNVAIITKSGSFTVPASCRGKIRRVLIGGGDGGSAGQDGKRGEWGQSGRYSYGGVGGLPGSPGAGGKVYVDTINVKPGQVFEIKIGKGGAGGSVSPAKAPEKGGATTMGNASSENGISQTHGFVDIYSSDRYGGVGVDGVQGGDGERTDLYPDQDTVVYNGITYYPGEPGGSTTDNTDGGNGGGAAVGANGFPGKEGKSYQSGDGGSGATPTVKGEKGKVYGQGGGGGHGGGGGGGGGRLRATQDSDGDDISPGIGGNGGRGGAGGDGADGAIIIYY